MTAPADLPRTVGARLRATADAHPDRVALELGRDRSTHAALSLAGRAVAATLQGLPERAHRPVVVVLGRAGRSSILGAVGGWLAGLAVAPIAPDLPSDQLARAIVELSPRALFVDGASRAVLPALLPQLPPDLPIVVPDAAAARMVRVAGDDAPVVAVERRASAAWRAVSARPGAGALHLWVPEPTGGRWLTLRHTALLDDVDRHIARHGVGEGDRVSHLHPLDNHRGLVDLLIAWSVGAAACAPGLNPGGQVGAWLREARLSILRITPTQLRSFEAAGAITPATLSTVRAVVLEGEGHRAQDTETLRSAVPRAIIDSVFGRAEVGSAVLVHRVQPGPVREARSIPPLGRPFPGVRVAVADPRGGAVEQGAGGELVVMGPDGQPVRTGDRVQVAQGRSLRHAGRMDDRIQLNGRRASLDAIGGVLAELTRAPVVVVGWPLAAPGSAQGLVAFVQAAEVDVDGVLDAAALRLPRGLLPSELLAVPGLPERADGQPDRLRLTRFLAGRAGR